MTVQFGANDRPVWLKTVQFGRTVHFRATVHFKDRPLSPFWTVHFGPDSFFIRVFIDPLTFLFKGKPFLLDSSIPEDEATLAELKQWQIPVDQLTAEQLGETQVNLDGKFYSNIYIIRIIFSMRYLFDP